MTNYERALELLKDIKFLGWEFKLTPSELMRGYLNETDPHVCELQ